MTNTKGGEMWYVGHLLLSHDLHFDDKTLIQSRNSSGFAMGRYTSNLGDYSSKLVV